jgi:hypothetical protein
MARMLMAAGAERLLLLVVFHTIARMDALLRLKWEDVNFEQKAVRLWTRKRRGGSWEYDWLPMNEDLEKVLWGLWQKRKAGEWVFINPFPIHVTRIASSSCARSVAVRVCHNLATTPSVFWRAICSNLLATYSPKKKGAKNFDPPSSQTIGGSAWESNPPTAFSRRHTGFEVRGPHQ